jgi:hypothetical protein
VTRDFQSVATRRVGRLPRAIVLLLPTDDFIQPLTIIACQVLHGTSRSDPSGHSVARQLIRQSSDFCDTITKDVFSSIRPATRIVILLVAMCAAARVSWAEDDTQVVRQPALSAPERLRPHRFLDTANVTLSGLEMAAIMGDAASTRRAFDRYPGQVVEADPIARPFVALGWSGQILGASLFVGGDIFARHLLHKAGHHRLERLLPLALSVLEVGVTMHNMQTLRALDGRGGLLPAPVTALP